MKLLLLIIFVFNIIMLPSANKEIDRQVMRGLESAYRFDWNKAEEIFSNLIIKYPDDPRGYHHLSGIYLWYFLGGKHNDDLNEFKKYSDLAIDKGGDKLKKDKKDVNLIYIIGANYSYRAIAFAKAGNYLDAAWASKKSESYLSDAIKINPNKNDAYLGLGLYNFAVAQIPSTFSWVLKLAGISGNMEEGVKLIARTAETGIYSKVEAQYYLAQILSDFYFEYKRSSGYLKKLINKYPKNILFNYSFAVNEIKQKDLSEAERILLSIVKQTDYRFRQIISFSNFLLGDIYYRKNEFDAATEYYLTFLNTSPDNDYGGIASYRLAVCYEMMGRREEAVNYFQFAGKGNMDIEDDIYAKRKGDIFIKREITEEEKEVIRFVNDVEAGKLKESLKQVDEIEEKMSEDKNRGEVYLALSEAAFLLKDYEKSLDFALVSLNLETTEEKWLKPFAFYYAARANKAMGREDAFLSNITEAERYSNFDYQNKLKHQLNVLKK
jgi:tetratricopeptide (TPR) repeat protein